MSDERAVGRLGTCSGRTSTRGEEREVMRRAYLQNVAGLALLALLPLATVPLYLRLVGIERYGVLLTIWIALGYATIFDLGLTRAGMSAVARLKGDRAARRAVLWNGLYLILAAGLAGLMVTGLAGSLLAHWLAPANPILRDELAGAIAPTALLVPLGLLTAWTNGMLEARERFLAANVMQAVATVLGHLVPLVGAALGHIGLETLVWSLCAARAATVLAMMILLIVTGELGRPTRLDAGIARELLGFGAWVSVTNILAPILTTLDQLAVSALLGAKAAAHYSIPARLIGPIQILAISMAKSVFPQLARLSPQESRDLAQRAYELLLVIMTLICAPAILAVKPFLGLWLGQEFAAEAAPAARILLLGGWANALAFIAASLLQSQGQPQVMARLHVLEIVPFLLAVALLVPTLGLTGAALAWSGRAIVDWIALTWRAGLVLDRERRLTCSAGAMALAALVAAGAGLSDAEALAAAPLLAMAIGVLALALLPELRAQLRQWAGLGATR